MQENRCRRRDVLRGMVGAGAGVLSAPAFGLGEPTPTLAEAAEAAFIYALPLVEMAASRSALFAQDGAVPNRIFHDRDLATPAFRTVTTPNNDTLYSRCWIDLAGGPVTIELPETGERYFSAALLDMYSDNFVILGTRTTGGGGGRYTLIGPDAAAPSPDAIRSPTRWAWLLIRTLIAGPEDKAAVHRLQDRIRVIGPSRPAPAALGTVGDRWNSYFADAQQLLIENPPPVTDAAMLARIAPLGLNTRGGFDPRRFSPAQVVQIEAGVAEARRKLQQRGRQGRSINGWVYGKANIGRWEQDYLYRAQVALGGLGALPRVEATYLRAVDAAGRLYFDPDSEFRLHFAAGELPPVDGFWSLTLYERTPAGQFFLAGNPLDRYSIGNRTPGLRYGADGSLTLEIGARERDPANWLPAPRGKPWSLVMRAYLPRDAIVSDTYAMPRLVPA